MKFPLNRPLRPDPERLRAYLDGVAERGCYTNFGPLEHELTARLEAFLGVENLLLVSNGTVALQVAFHALGVAGRVATTPFSFLATVSTLLWEGLEPVFADIDPATFNLDPRGLATLPDDIAAILPVHVYGNPCDVEAIARLGEQRGIPVIYDAAHAFGSRLGNASALCWGDAATLSFHATKIFHTVEGGAIVFRSRIAWERARALVNFGIDGADSALGTGINAKLSEYHAAAGLALLDRMDKVLTHRAALAARYRRILSGTMRMQQWHPQGYETGAYMPVLFSNEIDREAAMAALAAHGIASRRYFHPSLNSLPVLAETAAACPISEDVANRVVCLPLHADMSEEDVELIAVRLCEIVDGMRISH